MSAPHGPEEVRDTVVRTATRLFAAKGIASVSVGQVARAASVNLGLVHRYVGTKDDLVRACLRWAGNEITREVHGSNDPTLMGSTSELVGVYERLMAQASLEGFDLSGLGLEFPMMRSLIDQMVAAGISDHEARVRAVCSTALSAWRVLEPLVTVASDLEPDDAAAVDVSINDCRRVLSSRSWP